MKFASFFIHVENGRRRPGRSGIIVSLDFRKDENAMHAILFLEKAAIKRLDGRASAKVHIPFACCAVSLVDIGQGVNKEQGQR